MLSSTTIPNTTNNDFLSAFSKSNQEILSLAKELKSKSKEEPNKSISLSEQKAISERVLNQLNKAEENLGLRDNSHLKESVRELFLNVSKSDLSERLNQLNPVFDFLDSTFRLNKESQKLLTEIDTEQKSEIKDRSQKIMQKTYETVEDLPKIIKDEQKSSRGHYRITDQTLVREIPASDFFKKHVTNYINGVIEKLDQANTNQRDGKAQKVLDRFYQLLENFNTAPKRDTLKNLFNFRYSGMLSDGIQIDKDKQVKQFIELADGIDFSGLKNAIRIISKLSDKALKGNDYNDLKDFVKEESSKIEECSSLYKANEKAIINKIKESLELARPNVLTFLNKTNLDRMVKEHPSIKEAVEEGSRNNLMLTSLKIALDRIDNSQSYVRRAEQGIDVGGSSGRRIYGRSGSRAS